MKKAWNRARAACQEEASKESQGAPKEYPKNVEISLRGKKSLLSSIPTTHEAASARSRGSDMSVNFNPTSPFAPPALSLGAPVAGPVTGLPAAPLDRFTLTGPSGQVPPSDWRVPRTPMPTHFLPPFAPILSPLATTTPSTTAPAATATAPGSADAASPGDAAAFQPAQQLPDLVQTPADLNEGVADADAQADAQAQADAPAQMDAQAQADAPPQMDAQAQADAPAQMDAQAQADAPAQADTLAQADAQAQAEAQAQFSAQAAAAPPPEAAPASEVMTPPAEG